MRPVKHRHQCDERHRHRLVCLESQFESDRLIDSTASRSPSVSSAPQPENKNSGSSPVSCRYAARIAVLIGRSAPSGSAPASPILQLQTLTPSAWNKGSNPTGSFERPGPRSVSCSYGEDLDGPLPVVEDAGADFVVRVFVVPDMAAAETADDLYGSDRRILNHPRTPEGAGFSRFAALCL